MMKQGDRMNYERPPGRWPASHVLPTGPGDWLPVAWHHPVARSARSYSTRNGCIRRDLRPGVPCLWEPGRSEACRERFWTQSRGAVAQRLTSVSALWSRVV